MYFFHILAIICFITVLACFIWLACSYFSHRKVGGKKTGITVTVETEGSAGELEQSVKGLVWLIDTGTLDPRTQIVIKNAGFTRETAEIARILENEYHAVTIE